MQSFLVNGTDSIWRESVIAAGEIFDVAIALVPIDANLKLVGGEEFHELREDGSALVHPLPPEQAGKQ